MRALFLDRDGVINKEKPGSYIFHPGEFEFYESACAAMAWLSKFFDYLIIVTNQRGIGKGLMTEEQLEKIHDYLKKSIAAEGGKIDAIYFAPHLDNAHPRRKPNTGMALEAIRDFPDINFEESVMVGNNLSDMQFGKSMAMTTVFLHTTQPPMSLPHPLIDQQFASLKAWAENLKKQQL